MSGILQYVFLVLRTREFVTLVSANIVEITFVGCYVLWMLKCYEYLSYILFISDIEVNCYLRFNLIESQPWLKVQERNLDLRGISRQSREEALMGEAMKRDWWTKPWRGPDGRSSKKALVRANDRRGLSERIFWHESNKVVLNHLVLKLRKDWSMWFNYKSPWKTWRLPLDLNTDLANRFDQLYWGSSHKAAFKSVIVPQ